MTSQALNRPVDVLGILERAGADANASEGSQAWALAQVYDAFVDLADDARVIVLTYEKVHGVDGGVIARLRGKLEKIEGAI
jgi:hypothetical protein